MSIDKMTKQQEAGLIDSVTQAIKLANAGKHPNDALIQVAKEAGWNKHFIKRAVEAFNTSKAIKHRKEAKGEEKAAAFDIADPELIIKSLYPDTVAAPAEVKEAEWEPVGMNVDETRMFNLDSAPVLDKADRPAEYRKDLEMLMKRALDEQHRQETVVSDLRQKMAEHRLTLFDNLEKLAGYFRLNVHEPFDRVESAVLNHDPAAKCIMDRVWQMSKRASFKMDKRASGPAKVKYEDRTPYALLDGIFDAREAYAKTAVKCAAALQELTDYKKELRERMEKMSIAGGPLAPFILGQMLPKGSTEALKGFAATPTHPEDITSVQFDAERRGIQTKTMLHDFMKHDEVLSKADPKKVIQAYNDIASVAPRAAESPLIMRGLLRKSVETTSYDPYESANLVAIETGLKKKDAPVGAKVD